MLLIPNVGSMPERRPMTHPAPPRRRGSHLAQHPYHPHIRIRHIPHNPGMPRTDAERAQTKAQVQEWRRKAIQRAGKRKCECGCGETIPAVRGDGTTPRRFAVGHKEPRERPKSAVLPKKPRRTEKVLLRVTPAEKAMMEERAGELSLSEYIRRAATGVESADEVQWAGHVAPVHRSRRGLTKAERTRRRRTEAVKAQATEQQENHEKAERRDPGDFEALVQRYSRTMPRRNAETVARRELARG